MRRLQVFPCDFPPLLPWQWCTGRVRCAQHLTSGHRSYPANSNQFASQCGGGYFPIPWHPWSFARLNTGAKLSVFVEVMMMESYFFLQLNKNYLFYVDNYKERYTLKMGTGLHFCGYSQSCYLYLFIHTHWGWIIIKLSEINICSHYKNDSKPTSFFCLAKDCLGFSNHDSSGLRCSQYSPYPVISIKPL